MKEAQICTEVVNSLNSVGAWAWKIPDASPQARGSVTVCHNCGSKIFRKDRFIPARAFDVIAVCGGRAIAIEVKLLKAGGGLSIDKFTDFEIESLEDVSEVGGGAWIAIAYAYEASARAIEKGSKKRVRELWMVGIDEWMCAMARAACKGTKTVSRSDITELGISIPWAGKGIWDFGLFLRSIQDAAKGDRC